MGEEEDATLDWQVDHLVAKWFRPNFEAAQVSFDTALLSRLLPCISSAVHY